jgi:hypothetical protein
MNKYYVNNNFQGAIDGQRAVDYYRAVIKMDRGTAQENIENIKTILGIKEIDGVEFTDEFWTKVFLQRDEDEYIGGVEVILNKDTSLYSDSNIAKTLELMGTVILSGDKKKDNPNYIRVFHSQEMFRKAIDEQNAISHIADNTSCGKYAMENHLDDLFVLANQMNYKMEKRYNQLDDKRLEELDKEFGTKYPQVHDYYIGYVTMKNKLQEMINLKKERGYLTNEERNMYKLIKKNVRTLKEDFLDCIDKKARPIVFKAPLPDSGCPSWDEYDELNKEHIRCALQVVKGDDMQDDLSVIAKDLENTIRQCDFTDMQREVLQLLRADKTQEEIGEILGIKQPVVNKYIRLIVDKIYNKNLEKYEEWYYLNISKGKYKKCSQCGEVKLISKFDKNKNGTMGVRNTCKVCRNK